MERLKLEAVGVVMRGEVNHSTVHPETTASIEIRTVTLVGEEPSPLRFTKLDAVIDSDTWGEINYVLRSPTGRVRMAFEFYDDEDESDA